MKNLIGIRIPIFQQHEHSWLFFFFSFSKWMRLIGVHECPKSVVRTVKITIRAPHWSVHSWLISRPGRSGAGSLLLSSPSPETTGRPAEKQWRSGAWAQQGDGVGHTGRIPHTRTHIYRIACALCLSPCCPETPCHSLIKDSRQEKKLWVRKRSDPTDVKRLLSKSLSHFVLWSFTFSPASRSTST